jgi:16S rRNA (cytosine967-C5)-methyltransferase
VAQYGRATAEAICAFDQGEPRCAEMFAADTDATVPMMDAGSRLVAELAAAAQPEARRVWDCCAAPGGKTMVLAHRLPGAKVLATDLSPARLKRLRQRLGRELAGRAVEVELADAAALPETYGRFDLILCDVPCSGTGTLARNPEIRHRLRAEELGRQRERQERLLRAALMRLAPGGRLVYSTCSLEPEECEGVVADVVASSGGGVQLHRVEPLLERLRASGMLRQAPGQGWGRWSRDGCLRTLPGVDFEGDGFFAAILEVT